jgi:hypothetical protein
VRLCSCVVGGGVVAGGGGGLFWGVCVMLRWW